MQKKTITNLIKITLLVLVSNHISAQQYKGIGDTLDEKHNILFVVKIPNNSPRISENLIIDPLAVDSLSDLSNVKYLEFLKLLHVSTIWIVVPKKGIKFMSLTEILNVFKINKAAESSPVRIDNWVVNHPESVVAQVGEILNVLVVKCSSGNSFINIVTRHPLDRPKKVSKSGIIIH